MTMTKTEFVNNLSNDELKDFFINDLNEGECIGIFREAVVEEGNYDDADFFPFDEDEINTYFSTPYEAMRAAHFGDVSWNDEWLRFNAYGNLESISDITDYMCGYIDEMREYLCSNYEDAICIYFEFEEEEDEE